MIPGSNGVFPNQQAPAQGSALNAILWDTGDGGAVGFSAICAGFQGTFVATCKVQGTMDGGANWEDIPGTAPSNTGGSVDSLTISAVGNRIYPCSFPRLRCIISSWTSGTVVPAAYFQNGIPAAFRGYNATIAPGASLIGDVNLTPRTSITNNLTAHRLASAAASTNATSVVTSAKRLFGGVVTNAAAAIRYLKLYNKASAPTVGTDTPVITIQLPASSRVDLAPILGQYGEYFGLGIAYALTTGLVDSDTGALTAGDVQLTLRYA